MRTSWIVVYTKPHDENRALANLLRQGFDAYLPRYKAVRRHARKVENVQKPLFPRYMFVSIDPDAGRWRPILSTYGVSGIVMDGDRPAIAPDGVVDAIRARAASGDFDRTGPLCNLQPGDDVRVLDGPFADLVGRLQAVDDKDRVCVLLQMMGRAVRARIESSALEPA